MLSFFIHIFAGILFGIFSHCTFQRYRRITSAQNEASRDKYLKEIFPADGTDSFHYDADGLYIYKSKHNLAGCIYGGILTGVMVFIFDQISYNSPFRYVFNI